MRIAYLDCFSGISGDMFLGALIDAGISPDLLRDTVRALNVGAELEFKKVLRNGIAATKVDVIVNGEKDLPREEFWAQQHDHKHEHDHHHDHDHEHEHHDEGAPGLPSSGKPGSVPDSAHEHHHRSHERPHHHEHRSLKDIRAIIQAAPIASAAKKTALAIFQALGQAEAKIHNKDLDSIHFHEVGSVDAIVDIVCAAVGADSLGIDEWHCSALNVGGGVVHCAHGVLPVPAPATVELLKGAPTYSSGIQKELVTPTGAAIVKTLVQQFGDFPSMTITGSGFGAGARDLKDHANVLRITVGNLIPYPSRASVAREGGAVSPESSDTPDTITVLEATIDDMTPQVFGFVLERLLELGALDAYGLPVQMKKSRPGMLLTVLARNEDAEHLAETIFAETTTIGLRMRQEQRMTLQREFVPVETQWGTVRIKIARMHGEETNAAPEFEDCRKIAVEHHVALKRVMIEAMRIYSEQKDAAGA